MKQIFFDWEEVVRAKTIETTTDVIQVGFLNRGVNSIVKLNGFELYPQPPIGAPLNSNINDYILWLPIGMNEIDRTQYKIEFKIINPEVKPNNSLIVWYKLGRPNQKQPI